MYSKLDTVPKPPLNVKKVHMIKNWPANIICLLQDT